ncbi:MAG: SDR family oxidoreductase [Sphingomonadales bacterium]|nr:SDR family oxidoreductase [Sphingomonadales bacterium]
MTEISGKAAVVTGGGSGIGAGLARQLAKDGARVAVADIILDNAKRTVAQIEAAGGEAVAVHVDVCERDSIRAMKDEATRALGPVQLVFANAGATSFTPVVEMSDEDVEWILHVNLLGTTFTAKAFLEDIIAAGGGHICATASMAGLLPGWLPVHAPYSAAKAGIIGMMMNMAIELKPHNVFTTSYCPGAVASGMKENNGTYRPARFGGPEEKAEVVFKTTDTTHSSLRFYHPDDIAPIVLNAVRRNRPFVFDHADQRRFFHETYASVVEACYDDIEAWEAEHGLPEANPYGAALKQD